MIVGRESELVELRAALQQASMGQAQLVAIVGDPGVGKTTLLDALVQGADQLGVVRMAGLPSESTLGYAGLAVLCRCMASHLDALPPRQRRAIDVCMAEGETSQASPVDLLALGSALITLLAEAASESPVLFVVDDLQWVDPESRRALGFATRRLSSERVLVVLAARIETVVPDSVTRRIRLSALTAGQVREILDELHPGLDDEAAAGIVDRAHGNPLAVVELGRGLSAARTGSLTRLASTSGALEDLQTVYSDQLAELSSRARAALLLAACDGRVDLALVAATLESTGEDVSGIDELVASGLLIVTDTHASLRHPLLAAAAMAAAGPVQVRTAHASLSAALDPQDAARSLWHRAQATVGVDETLAARIAEAGGRASRTGRPDEATRSYELAATLTLSSERRARWLVDAAESALASADSTRAATLAGRARDAPPGSPELLARIQVLECQVVLRLGWRNAIGELIVTACRSLERDRAVPVLVRIARAALVERDVETARRALDQLESLDGGSAEFREAVGAFCAFDRNDPVPPREVVDRIHGVFDRSTGTEDLATLALVGGLAMEWGRITLARGLFLHAGQVARAGGDLDDITNAAFGVAFSDHTLGAWTSAFARSLEVSKLLTEADIPERLCEALLLQAEIDSARGQSDRCRATCSQIRELAAQLVDPVTALLAERREALLDLGLGRLEPAAARLESVLVTTRLQGLDHPYHSPIPDLVEVYVRSNRTDEARAVAPEFLGRVGRLSPPLPRARALRIEGLLADRGAYDDAFSESVQLDLSVGLIFHAARTLLCHGERLRRDRRRVEARGRLHMALDIFQRLEAAPWARRCELELAASGAAVTAPRDQDVSILLTPQELQVAVLVGEGRRNREIAETLFLSLRTVESHLSRVFRKLGVDTRTQLAVRMNGAP